MAKLRLFQTLKAANAEITGYWQERQPGVIGPLASAAKFNAARFDGAVAIHKRWGLFPGATESRYAEILRDLMDFKSGLQLSAWKLGAWPVKMLGTQSDLSLAWIVNYLFSFAAQIPVAPDSPLVVPGPDSSEAREHPSSPG